MPLNRFGEGSTQYDFTASSVVLDGPLEDNFRQTAEQLVSLPGTRGGFSEYGRGTPPTVAGEVRQQLVLVSQTPTGMDDLRDALFAMQHQGVQPLIKTATDPSDDERYCMAYVSAIHYTNTDQGDARTRRHQPVEIIWRAPDPRWYAVPDSEALWGEAWGGNWQGARNTIAASGLTTDTTISYSGNTPTSVRLYVKTGGSQTCENPTIQRLRSNAVVEQVAYAATMGNSETLKINAQRHDVWLNGARSYDANFTRLTATWLTLEPGSNVIRVRFANSGDAASVELYYLDAYL